MSPLNTVSYSFNDNHWNIFTESEIKYDTDRLNYVEEKLENFYISPKSNFKEALDILFRKVPDFVLKNVKEITENTTQHIFIIRMEANADIIYGYSFESSIESGWRYYITGMRGAGYKTRQEFQFINKKSNIEPLIRGSITQNDIEINKLIDTSNNHCFELKIKDKTILLDCGLPFFSREKNKDQTDFEFDELNKLQHILNRKTIDWIILTHNHQDHTSGVSFLLHNEFNKISKIIGTKTTLSGFYTVVKRSRDENFHSKFRELSSPVNFFTSIDVAKNCKMYFYPAGHIPGSLSILIQITDLKDNEESSSNEWNFLYTSDFYLQSIPPIDGFNKSLKFLPKIIDFAIIDGSNSNKINTPLKTQLSDIYKEALDACEKNGSVMIATEAYSHALFFYMEFHQSDYNRKDKTSNKSLVLPKIFLDNNILKAIERISLFPDDLSEEIQVQMKTLKNPFESWRIQPMKSLRSVYEALSGHSIILTSPTDVQQPPLKDSFPLCSMDEKNLFLFGYFTQNDLKTREGIFNSKITLSSKTNLNGILSEEQDIIYNPKCRILNKEGKYVQYLFQNHADKKDLEQISLKLQIKEPYFFHKDKKISMEKLFPKN